MKFFDKPRVAGGVANIILSVFSSLSSILYANAASNIAFQKGFKLEKQRALDGQPANLRNPNDVTGSMSPIGIGFIATLLFMFILTSSYEMARIAGRANNISSKKRDCGLLLLILQVLAGMPMLGMAFAEGSKAYGDSSGRYEGYKVGVWELNNNKNYTPIFSDYSKQEEWAMITLFLAGIAASFLVGAGYYYGKSERTLDSNNEEDRLLEMNPMGIFNASN